MYRATRLKITELNPHLVCVLCGGYLIDATTIVECLHSFCKTCIVRYLESSKFCPICDVQVHKTKPLLNIRLDHTLQDIVYKLVPNLFKEEMTRRRDFYKEKAENDEIDWRSAVNSSGAYIDDDGELQQERVIFSADEQISLALYLSVDGRPPCRHFRKNGDDPNQDCRYLLCPAGVTIGHLKKFIRMKFNLYDRFQIDVYHTDEALNDTLTLMDVAYVYLWRRKGPMRLFYTVYSNPAKRFKRTATCTVTSETADHSNTMKELEKEKISMEETNMIQNNIQRCNSKPTENLKDKHIETVSASTASVAATAAPPSLSSVKEKPSSSSSSSSPEKTSCVTNNTLEKSTEKTTEKSSERTRLEPVTLNTPSPRLNGVSVLPPFALMNGHHNGTVTPVVNHSNHNSHHDNEVAQDLSMKKKTPPPLLLPPPPLPKENGEKSEKSLPPKPNGLLPNGEVDKFAFTDDDDVLPLSSHKLSHVHVKSEPVTIE